MKIRPVGAELFHADGRTQTDMTQQTEAHRNIALRKLMASLKHASKAHSHS